MSVCISGVLKKYKCQVLGTPISSIIETEDRDLFAKKLEDIGEKCAPSYAASTLEECCSAGKLLGYPVLVRATFALGGLGSGFAQDEKSLLELCKEAFNHSKQVRLYREKPRILRKSIIAPVLLFLGTES